MTLDNELLIYILTSVFTVAAGYGSIRARLRSLEQSSEQLHEKIDAIREHCAELHPSPFIRPPR